jgi:hypothetical protein
MENSKDIEISVEGIKEDFGSFLEIPENSKVFFFWEIWYWKNIFFK